MNKRLSHCAQILAALREFGSLTTSDIRSGMNVYHAAGRIRDLRKQGHAINTLMGWWPDVEGRLHYQARYTFLGRAE